MITKEKIQEFITRAYDTACAHGFHDEERSDEHLLMLVVGEIGEIVEADRKNRHANPVGFEKCIGIGYGQRFRDYVKDSVEDELADVVIRLCDYCGKRGLMPAMPESGVLEMPDEFNDIFGQMSICEQCFSLSSFVVDMAKYADKKTKEHDLGMILSFCFEFARFHGIDLEWHIEQKMKYNEMRPYKHGGKKY